MPGTAQLLRPEHHAMMAVQFEGLRTAGQHSEASYKSSLAPSQAFFAAGQPETDRVRDHHTPHSHSRSQPLRSVTDGTTQSSFQVPFTDSESTGTLSSWHDPET
eukprot:3417469-Rhodomonas_salina.2